MSVDYKLLTAEKLVRRLDFAGRALHPDLIQAIFDREAETRPLLRRLFAESYQDKWRSEDDPRWIRFIHAGKLLLAWKDEAAIPIFADFYLDDDKAWACEWFEEDPADFGPAAVPEFGRVVQAYTGVDWHYGRALMANILVQIALRHPETRDEIVSILRSVLPPPDRILSLDSESRDENWTIVIGELAMLKDEASKEQIIALFDAGLLRTDMIDSKGYFRLFEQTHQPNPSFDLLQEYRGSYEHELKKTERRLEEQRRKKEERQRLASPAVAPKIGRNDPCPCGSGKKHKQCHGRPGAPLLSSTSGPM